MLVFNLSRNTVSRGTPSTRAHLVVRGPHIVCVWHAEVAGGGQELGGVPTASYQLLGLLRLLLLLPVLGQPVLLLLLLLPVLLLPVRLLLLLLPVLLLPVRLLLPVLLLLLPLQCRMN